MRKIFLLLAVAIVFFGCLKSNDTKPCILLTPVQEEQQLINFCNTNRITYTKDTNGIFYQILDPGSGVTPNLNSKITVTYTSTFLDNTQLEDYSNIPVTNYLKEFIEGWRLAIPYIQQGGHIKMIIPSSLCYGCSGLMGRVPPNTPLYYNVVLINVE